jgi:hypothetical protein
MERTPGDIFILGNLTPLIPFILLKEDSFFKYGELNLEIAFNVR